MLQFALYFRHTLLIAAIAIACAALLTMGLGAWKIVTAVKQLVEGAEPKSVVATIMAGTDTFLFSVVLVIMAGSIAFGFALDLSAQDRERLPSWLRQDGLTELKTTLMSVLLIYLCVDFATDWLAGELPMDHTLLLKPIAILLLAVTTKLLNHDTHATRADVRTSVKL